MVPPVYALCYRDKSKREHLTAVSKSIGAPFILHEGLSSADPRLRYPEDVRLARLWSITFGHLDMMRHFLNTSTSDYGIFTEHDILVHRDFRELIEVMVADMPKLELDVMLLGYLRHPSYRLDPLPLDPSRPLAGTQSGITYYAYPDNLWGAQMYMVTKAYAKELLGRFDLDYAVRTTKDDTLTPFNPDWLFTKKGRRACIQPMLAMEDGLGDYSDEIHGRFHRECYLHNFRAGVYL